MKPEEIKRKRKERGLTQEALANLLDVHITTIFRWEAGIVSPNLSIMKSLREILDGFDTSASPITDFLLSHGTPAALLGLDGVYRRANPAFLLLLDRQDQDITGNAARDVFPELARAMSKKYGESFELALKRRRVSYRLTCAVAALPGKFISHRLDLLPEEGFEARYVHEIALGDLPSRVPHPTHGLGPDKTSK